MRQLASTVCELLSTVPAVTFIHHLGPLVSVYISFMSKETRDQSNLIKGNLLNIPTAGMTIYAHPRLSLGSVLGHTDRYTIMPPGKRQQTKLHLQCFSMDSKSPKIAPSLGGIRNLYNTWLLGLTPPHTPNAISIEPAVSSGLTIH